MKHYWLYSIALFTFISCTNTSPDDLIDSTPITEFIAYDTGVAPIIQSQCLPCHDSTTASGNLILENYLEVRTATENGSLIDRITRNAGDPLIMPQNSQLPSSSINLIIQWEMDGYLEN